MLLPSQQLADLSQRFSICLSGKTSPANCDVRYRQLYWLMVFDKRGELRHACRLGDELGRVTKQGFDVPNAFVEIVEGALQQPASLQQLQRDYVAAAGSQSAFEALDKKLKALQGVGQMHTAQWLAKVADNAKEPVLSRARGLMLEADACSHQVLNHAAFLHLRKGIVAFVQAHPDHTMAEQLLEPLLEVGMKYTFDVAARCRAYARQWRSADATVAAKKIADLLLKHGDQLVAKARLAASEMKPSDYGYLRLLAVCGDAKATLAKLASTKTLGVFRPIHEEWRAEARAKLAGSK